MGFLLLSVVLTITALELTLLSPTFSDKFLDQHPLEELIIDLAPKAIETAGQGALSTQTLEQIKSDLASSLSQHPITPAVKTFSRQFIINLRSKDKDPLDTVFPGGDLKEPVFSIIKSVLFSKISAMPLCSSNADSGCRPRSTSVSKLFETSTTDINKTLTDAGLTKYLSNQPLGRLIGPSWTDKVALIKSVTTWLLFINRLLFIVLIGLFLLSLILIRHQFGPGLRKLGKAFAWFSTPSLVVFLLLFFLWPIILSRLGSISKGLIDANSSGSKIIDSLGDYFLILNIVMFGAVTAFGLLLFAIGKLIGGEEQLSGSGATPPVKQPGVDSITVTK